MRDFGWFCASMIGGIVAGLLVAFVCDVFFALSDRQVKGIAWGIVSFCMFEGGKRSQREQA